MLHTRVFLLRKREKVTERERELSGLRAVGMAACKARDSLLHTTCNTFGEAVAYEMLGSGKVSEPFSPRVPRFSF